MRLFVILVLFLTVPSFANDKDSPASLLSGSEIELLHPLTIYGNDTTLGPEYGNFSYSPVGGSDRTGRPAYIGGDSYGCILMFPYRTREEPSTLQPQIMQISAEVRETTSRYRANAYWGCAGRDEVFIRGYTIPLQSDLGEVVLICKVQPKMMKNGCPGVKGRDAHLTIGQIRSLLEEDLRILDRQ